MPEPTQANVEKFQRNPPRDPFDGAREKFRRNPPTPLGSLATTGGPATEPGIAQAEQAQAARPETGSAGPLLETGLSIAAGAFPGGMLAGRLGSGMVSRLGRLGAEILGRGSAAALGGVAGSELGAPNEETSGEALARRGIAAGTSFAGEAMTPGLKAVLSPAITPIRARLGGLGARELLELGAEESQALLQSMGRTLTPGQLRTGKLLDTFENMVSASFGGGQVMGIHQRRTEASVLAHMENVIPGLTKDLSSEDAGLMLGATLRGEVRLDRAATSAAYRNATSAIAQAGGTGEIVPVQSILTEATKRLGSDPKDAGALEIMSSLRRHGDVSHLTLEQAENLRSDLLAIGRRGEGVLPTPKILANELAKKLDDSMTLSTMTLGRFGPDVVDAVKGARALSRVTHARWDHELVAGLIDQVKPEQLPKIILADDNPTQLRMVKEVLRDPKYRIGRMGADGTLVAPIKNPKQVWRGLQSAWITEKQTLAGGGKYSTIDGKRIGSLLDSAKGTAKELFEGQEKSSLRISMRALELLQKTSAGLGKEGKMWIQLTQASALGVMIGFGPDNPAAFTGAGFILLGPIPAALALTNPRFANFMLKAAQTSSSRVGRLTGSMAAQTISHLVKEKVPFQWNGTDGQTAEYDPETQSHEAPAAPKPISKF